MTVRTESRIDAFRRTVPFELDPFQVDAIEQLGTHQGVLVSAPTSSGKTVVADYAIFEALEDGVKAIYTTPLKALTNHKFRDLKRRHGNCYPSLGMWPAMGNRLPPIFDEQGKVVRGTWNKAQEEVAADHRFDRDRRRGGRRFEPRGRQVESNSLTRVIESLAGQQMLPAIYFIFSRRGCEEAMQRCAMHGLDLTNSAEKARIEEFVAGKMAEVVDADEANLYRGLLNHEMLVQGISVHHAGLLPFLKELVDELFHAGLVKVLFATQPLALC